MVRTLMIAGVLVAGAALAGCDDYYGPPPGYAGAEPYRVHVRRCLRNFPNYNPRTDLIMGPNGARPCPL